MASLASSATKKIIQNRTMAFSPKNLNNGNRKASSFTPGEHVVYNGEPILMTASNGVSSLIPKDSQNGDTLYLNPGTKLVVCNKQYGNPEDGTFDFKDFTGKKMVICHFRREALKTHESNCSCGHCGYVWAVLDGDCCSCEAKPFKAGSEQCVIC